MQQDYDLPIEDINTIFNHPETVDSFKDLVNNSRSAKVVYKWMYNHLFGNITKKELDFKQVLTTNFRQAKLLGELIDISKGTNGKDKLLSQNNAKTLMYGIIDNKYDLNCSLVQMVEQEFGPLNEAAEINYQTLIEEVITNNPKILQKITKAAKKENEKAKKGPVMFLVGQVMQKTNK